MQMRIAIWHIGMSLVIVLYLCSYDAAPTQTPHRELRDKGDLCHILINIERLENAVKRVEKNILEKINVNSPGPEQERTVRSIPSSSTFPPHRSRLLQSLFCLPIYKLQASGSAPPFADVLHLLLSSLPLSSGANRCPMSSFFLSTYPRRTYL
ncbi:hypothetical protein GGR58DRAFT_219893 [Xylaria digitata]|nr:hypothetical protein GGR58DRAFT_219893 [Xylaria digitata]